MTRRLLVAAASGLLGFGLVGSGLAGCGVGQDAATASTQSSIPGVNADRGGIAVRNAVVAAAPTGYARGDDAPITLSILNRGSEPVRLVSATSAIAASVAVVEAVRVGVTAPPEPVAAGGGELAVPPGALVSATLRASGLTEELDGTRPVPVALSFDNGAVLSLNVPTASPPEPLPREPMTFDEGEEH